MEWKRLAAAGLLMLAASCGDGSRGTTSGQDAPDNGTALNTANADASVDALNSDDRAGRLDNSIAVSANGADADVGGPLPQSNSDSDVAVRNKQR
jgi:hypothetical protein